MAPATKKKSSKGPKVALQREGSGAGDPARPLTLEQRLAAAKLLWEHTPQAEMQQLLSVPLESIRQSAQQLDAAAGDSGGSCSSTPAAPSLTAVLDEGLTRLRATGSWKVWKISTQQLECQSNCPADCWEGVQLSMPDNIEPLLPLLPFLHAEQPQASGPQQPGHQASESPGQAAFRLRMAKLLKEQRHQLRPRHRTQTHDVTVDVLEALQHEHEHRALLQRVCRFVCDSLPEGKCQTTPDELQYADLDKLTKGQEEQLVEWLLNKVAQLSWQVGPEIAPSNSKPVTFAAGGSCLAPHPDWLRQLEAVAAEEGAEPLHRFDPLVVWVYGLVPSIDHDALQISTSPLGEHTPTAQSAYNDLLLCLQHQQQLAASIAAATAMLQDMLLQRKEVGELCRQYNIQPGKYKQYRIEPGKQQQGSSSSSSSSDDAGAVAAGAAAVSAEQAVAVPYSVVVKVLKREALLIEAELSVKAAAHQALLRTLQTKKLRVQQAELHRATMKLYTPQQYAEDVRLAVLKHQQAEQAVAQSDEDSKSLTAWQDIVKTHGLSFSSRQQQQQCPVDNEQQLQDHTQQQQQQAGEQQLDVRDPCSSSSSSGGGSSGSSNAVDAGAVQSAETAQEQQVTAQGHLRQDSSVHWHPVLGFLPEPNSLSSIVRQMHSDSADIDLFNSLTANLKSMQQQLEVGGCVLQHLGLALLHVAADNPGVLILEQLLLPLLQQQVDAVAAVFCAERSERLQKELLASWEADTPCDKAGKQHQQQAKKSKQKQQQKKAKPQAIGSCHSKQQQQEKHAAVSGGSAGADPAVAQAAAASSAAAAAAKRSVDSSSSGSSGGSSSSSRGQLQDTGAAAAAHLAGSIPPMKQQHKQQVQHQEPAVAGRSNQDEQQQKQRPGAPPGSQEKQQQQQQRQQPLQWQSSRHSSSRQQRQQEEQFGAASSNDVQTARHQAEQHQQQQPVVSAVLSSPPATAAPVSAVVGAAGGVLSGRSAAFQPLLEPYRPLQRASGAWGPRAWGPAAAEVQRANAWGPQARAAAAAAAPVSAAVQALPVVPVVPVVQAAVAAPAVPARAAAVTAAAAAPAAGSSVASAVAAAAAAAGGVDNEDEENLCVICHEARRTHALMHGRSAHYCLCEQCSDAYDHAQLGCPICRQPVTCVLRMF